MATAAKLMVICRIVVKHCRQTKEQILVHKITIYQQTKESMKQQNHHLNKIENIIFSDHLGAYTSSTDVGFNLILSYSSDYDFLKLEENCVLLAVPMFEYANQCCNHQSSSYSFARTLFSLQLQHSPIPKYFTHSSIHFQFRNIDQDGDDDEDDDDKDVGDDDDDEDVENGTSSRSPGGSICRFLPAAFIPIIVSISIIIVIVSIRISIIIIIIRSIIIIIIFIIISIMSNLSSSSRSQNIVFRPNSGDCHWKSNWKWLKVIKSMKVSVIDQLQIH